MNKWTKKLYLNSALEGPIEYMTKNFPEDIQILEDNSYYKVRSPFKNIKTDELFDFIASESASYHRNKNCDDYYEPFYVIMELIRGSQSLDSVKTLITLAR
jgi:hypothetical protein